MTPASNSSQSETPIECRIQVRYAETDQMGVVYYANYLVWFEVARTELCRQRGFRYADMERDTGCFLIVTEAHCNYRSPARYDDTVVLRCRVKSLRSRSVAFAYEAIQEATGKLLAEGETVHMVKGRDGRLRSFPQHQFDCLARGAGIDGQTG